MAERLVDVLNGSGSVIHTYLVTLGELGNKAHDPEYLAKALEAAAAGRLVPDPNLGDLTARIHVDRTGQMATYGDNMSSGSETKIELEQQVRERAYFGNKTVAQKDATRNIGNARLTSIRVSALTSCGSKREVRKDAQTRNGSSFSRSRRSNPIIRDGSK